MVATVIFLPGFILVALSEPLIRVGGRPFLPLRSLWSNTPGRSP